MAKKWDNPGIKAELERRGYTLTSLAREKGLAENACRRALCGSSLDGAIAIADALDAPFEEVWPGRYLRYIRRLENGATKNTRKASPNRDEASDRGAAA